MFYQTLRHVFDQRLYKILKLADQLYKSGNYQDALAYCKQVKTMNMDGDTSYTILALRGIYACNCALQKQTREVKYQQQASCTKKQLCSLFPIPDKLVHVPFFTTKKLIVIKKYRSKL